MNAMCVIPTPSTDLPPCVLSAQALQLPLIPPNLPEKDKGLFPTGANFAVYGSTAMPPEYYRRWNHDVRACYVGVQMGWFKQMLQRIAPWDGRYLLYIYTILYRVPRRRQEASVHMPNRLIIPSGAKRQILSESLIVLGEIGGNDYNFWFAARRPREQAGQFIPDIVATIGSAAQVSRPTAHSFFQSF